MAGFRKLLHLELHNLYCPPDVVGMVKSKKVYVEVM
jgi:hypothetical protein